MTGEKRGAAPTYEDIVLPITQPEVVEERSVVHVTERDHVLARRQAGRVERHDVPRAGLHLELLPSHTRIARKGGNGKERARETAHTCA